ncbi:DUF2244 domain-containing protein [Martelella sp. HB161492]|uniref:DUF2244 domain-containing protein n=1 Tax=Martelella sp. HB161492 TaxID=2720726 RepID=UPI0015918256|nr:DUF2244 domain-containing protein [Martelella sp. HB161492]
MSEHVIDISGEPPVFSAELFPHRSLGRKGFRALIGVSGLVALAELGTFLHQGAWPIALFSMLPVAAIIIAFAVSNRAARMREAVFVSRETILVRRHFPSGRLEEMRFNPFGARLDIDRSAGIGIVAMRITARGEGTEIGAFLNPADRESFARAFRTALASVTRRI